MTDSRATVSLVEGLLRPEAYPPPRPTRVDLVTTLSPPGSRHTSRGARRARASRGSRPRWR